MNKKAQISKVKWRKKIWFKEKQSYLKNYFVPFKQCTNIYHSLSSKLSIGHEKMREVFNKLSIDTLVLIKNHVIKLFTI